MRTQTRALHAAAAATLLLLVACGGDPGPVGPVGPDGPTSGRGWLGGEPTWESRDSGAGDSGAPGATSEELAAPTDRSASGADDRGGPPRAGSVDDNADYAAYLQYLRRIDDLGVELRPFDPRGRVVVTVLGTDGRPAAGEPLTFRSGGDEVATVRTTADGTARFLPGVFGAPVDGSFTVDGETVEAGSDVTLTVDRPGGAGDGVPLDVMFLLDATGSMGDEIDRLKTSIDSVATRVAALEGLADVRFGMTVYRDHGDAFVTRTFDLTDDVAAFRGALEDVRADGGGDYPEAMEEALAETLEAPSWRAPGEAVQLVFLVADAPPHTASDVAVTYPDAVRDAVERGIKVFPVASSESDDQAEAVFRQVAQATGARFVFLSYGAGGAATGDSTDIDRTDYEELALDDLVVRLTAEEVAALTGVEVVVPGPGQDETADIDPQQD